MADPTIRDTVWIQALHTAAREGEDVDVYDLADETGVNVSTVRQTLHVMTEYGFLDRKHAGNGAVVYVSSRFLEWNE